MKCQEANEKLKEIHNAVKARQMPKALALLDAYIESKHIPTIVEIQRLQAKVRRLQEERKALIRSVHASGSVEGHRKRGRAAKEDFKAGRLTKIQHDELERENKIIDEALN